MADQLFKKRSGDMKVRKEKIREIKPDRYLIVCEGAETEKNYFDVICKRINDKFGSKLFIDDRNKNKCNRIDIEGTGRNCIDLIKYTRDRMKREAVSYGRVWCVFDKDDFKDFDEAIKLAQKEEIETAWSNESFELWFLLYFDYFDSGVGRKNYEEKLNKYFEKYNLNGGKYQKNIKNIHIMLVQDGRSVESAIKNAKRLDRNYSDDILPSKRFPATKVYKLVEELHEYLKR